MSDNHPDIISRIRLIRNTNNLESEFKDIVLKFLFTFNLFESFFFEEPKWYDSKSGNAPKITVKDRINAMQEHCNLNNYNITSIKNLKRFQLHFSTVYKDTNGWTERFNSLGISDTNRTGLSKSKIIHLKNFLTQPLENNLKYAIQNALILSYVFRNNLFHGKKDITDLKNYEKDFIVISDFIISLMEYFNETNANVF